MKIEIYQLPYENENAYKPYDEESFDINNYNKVYDYDFDVQRYKELFGNSKNSNNDFFNDFLEEIFFIFNVQMPKDYCARSMSVSDVVSFEYDGKKYTYYCDSIGWSRV